MTPSWSLAAFAARVGERFVAHTAAGPRQLELVEARAVAQRGTRDAALRAEPYSLLFRVADGVALPQGTYRVEHPELAALEVFLVPVGAGLDEAVFN